MLSLIISDLVGVAVIVILLLIGILGWGMQVIEWIRGCKKESTLDRVPGSTKKIASEGTAIFWFNSSEISRGGNPDYGAYVIRTILSNFQTKGSGQESLQELYKIFDGDCYGPITREWTPENPVEAENLKRAVESAEILYAVLVNGLGFFNFSQVDKYLRQTIGKGYIGVRTHYDLGSMDFPKIFEDARRMSLVFSLTIKMGIIIKESFEILSDDELRSMGFDVEHRLSYDIEQRQPKSTMPPSLSDEGMSFSSRESEKGHRCIKSRDFTIRSISALTNGVWRIFDNPALILSMHLFVRVEVECEACHSVSKCFDCFDVEFGPKTIDLDLICPCCGKIWAKLLYKEKSNRYVLLNG